MALTSTTLFDVVGATQSITFDNPSQIDQIIYSSGAITLPICSSYSLSKADFALLYQYTSAFYNLLFVNFNTVSIAIPKAWPTPGTEFILNTLATPERIIYTYNSVGSLALKMVYLPLSGTVTISARPAPITIKLQEFFANYSALGQFSTQVAAS